MMAPRRSLLSLLLFVLLFYLLPLQAVLRAAFNPLTFALPTFGLAGLPDPLIMQVNIGYMLALAVGYTLVYLLVELALRLLRAYHWDQALAWLGTVTSVKDLRGLDNLLIQTLPLVALGFALAIPFWHTEGVAVLAALAWLGLAASRLGGAGQVVPIPAPQPVRPLPQEDLPDGDVPKRYTWEFPERAGARRWLPVSRFTVDLLISSARYNEYRERERELNVRRYDTYVTAPTPEVEVLAGKLLRLGRQRGFRSYDQASNTLAFTQQCIRYTADRSPETGEPVEYPKYPIESLMEEAGDCEDQAILTAALLKRMGYDVALLIFPGHVAVGVAGAEGLPGAYVTDPATGIRYFYAETTTDGWLLGELPKELEPYLAKGQFEIVPVVMRVSD